MFLELPTELLLQITEYLERADIDSLMRTCRRLLYFFIDKFHLYDIHCQTPLIIAAALGHTETIRQLLTLGVDTAARNVFGQTALLVAAKAGHEAVIELLLRVGVQTRNPEDAFTAAIMKLKPFDRNSMGPNGQAPLSVASEEGHEAVVKLLLAAHGVEPDHKDSHGRTPLALASASGHQGVVTLFLDTNRVDPDSTDSNGRTPLSLAAENWHENVVQLLLTAHVNPASEDTRGLTPLDWARIGRSWVKGNRGEVDKLMRQIPVTRLLQVAVIKRDLKKSVYRQLLPIVILLISIWSLW